MTFYYVALGKIRNKNLCQLHVMYMIQRTLTKTRESTELRGAHFSGHNVVRPVGDL